MEKVEEKRPELNRDWHIKDGFWKPGDRDAGTAVGQAERELRAMQTYKQQKNMLVTVQQRYWPQK